jgi:hypothetical protein
MVQTYKRAGLLFLCVIAVCAGRAAAQQGPTASRLEHADTEPQNWMTY